MVEQSQVREGLFEITLRYRSFVSVTRRTFVEIISGDSVVMLQKRRRAAIVVTRRSHPRIFVHAVAKKGSGPEVGHKRMSECHAWCRGCAACRDPMLEHFIIPL
jgi:hypothetical protein